MQALILATYIIFNKKLKSPKNKFNFESVNVVLEYVFVPEHKHYALNKLDKVNFR